MKLESKVNEIMQKVVENEAQKICERAREEMIRLYPFYECNSLYEAIALRKELQKKNGESED